MRHCIQRFLEDGLLLAETDGTYRFSPASKEAAQVVADVSQAYRERRVTIVQLIYNKPSEILQDFAEAFRLGKKN